MINTMKLVSVWEIINTRIIQAFSIGNYWESNRRELGLVYIHTRSLHTFELDRKSNTNLSINPNLRLACQWNKGFESFKYKQTITWDRHWAYSVRNMLHYSNLIFLSIFGCDVADYKNIIPNYDSFTWFERSGSDG